MYTISTAAAAVTGARHLRVGRNGQDAAAAWSGDGYGAVVVCDGCSSGAYSEVGARLGAQLGLRLIRNLLEPCARQPHDATATRSRLLRLRDEQVAEPMRDTWPPFRVDAGEPAGAAVRPRDIWPVVRAQLAAELGRIADQMPGSREQIVRDHFLFTLIAAAWNRDEVAVWALGDGGYALGDRVVTIGPFANNQPPYLGYDLLGDPQPSHLEVADVGCGQVAVMTDGVTEVLGPRGLGGLVDDRCFANPDGLRRRLAVLAKGSERIDWDERRVVRQPAALQDDGALAVAKWSVLS